MSIRFTITSTIISKFHKVCPSSSALASTIISKFHNQILYIHHYMASLIHKTTANSLRFKFKFYREGETGGGGGANLPSAMSCSSGGTRGRGGVARSEKQWADDGQTSGWWMGGGTGKGEVAGHAGWRLWTSSVRRSSEWRHSSSVEQRRAAVLQTAVAGGWRRRRWASSDGGGVWSGDMVCGSSAGCPGVSAAFGSGSPNLRRPKLGVVD
jgi:hypothetical protein